MKSTNLLTKPQVVIDTNIFVSAFIWGGNPKKVVEHWLKGSFSLFISPYLLTEIILTLSRFDFGKKDLDKLKYNLELHSLKIIPLKKTKICRDKKDDQILDLCLESRADFLITGDKDLLVLKKFQNTKIVKPRDFLKIMRKI